MHNAFRNNGILKAKSVGDVKCYYLTYLNIFYCMCITIHISKNVILNRTIDRMIYLILMRHFIT